MTDAPEPHKKTKLEELDTTAPYADRTEDPTATAILRKKKKPNVRITHCLQFCNLKLV